ncbi:MAG: pilus assembly protein [Pseudonocardiaceae bacterium]|nr:pilus assembly protein [Pseudonocardiaceae bacterium]
MAAVSRAAGREPGGTGDRGAVTVEAALALCSLVLVLALALAGVAAVSAQLRCIDAAREAARLTARGEQQRGEQAARRLAPDGAAVEIAVRGDEVSVRVAADPVAGLLPGVDVTAEAFAVLEPGVSGELGVQRAPVISPEPAAVP